MKIKKQSWVKRFAKYFIKQPKRPTGNFEWSDPLHRSWLKKVTK